MKAAEQFEVSGSSAIRWVQRFRENGTGKPSPRRVVRLDLRRRTASRPERFRLLTNHCRPLDAETLRQIKDAWHEHTVLLFRGQSLSEDDQRRFASYFGAVAKRVPPKPGATGVGDAPAWNDMMLVSDKLDANGKPLGTLGHGEMWFHTDKCYHRRPHRASFLYGIEIPSAGGHTKFSSMYAAYDRLPADLKRRLDGAMVMQGQQYGVGRRIDVTLPLDSTHHCRQPILLTNPGSGRKALYVASQNSMWIEDMPRDESEALLQRLFEIAEDPAIIYEHVWRVGDLIMWDNLACLHARTDWPSEQRRTSLHRRGRAALLSAFHSGWRRQPQRAGQSWSLTMKLLRRQVLLLAAGAATLSVASRTAGAQTYPSRPITMVVPFAAGGPADVVGRIIAERMRASLGQPIIIENVTGAAGTIGTGRVARASPDGYTLSIGPGSSTHVINGAIYTLPYDVLNDFEPIALLSNIPHIIVANKAVPADDLKGLIGWLKANPDSASQGTSGVGSVGHIVGVFFQKETGTRFYFVPYRGLAPAMQDLLAGRVDMMIDLPLNSLPHVRAGTIKAYAVTARTRLAAAPDIPTVDQAGLPGFYSSTWYSIYAPRRTSKDIVGKLNAAVVDVLADPAMRSRFIELGHEIVPREQQTPEALGDLQKAEIEKWWSILKTANIKGE